MFREVLQEIVNRTEGCLGALIMGTDGIAVEKVWHSAEEQANFDLAVTEYASLLRNARRTSEIMGLGRIKEFTLSTTTGGSFILRFVSEDYFISILLSGEGNFGRGRFELQRAELLLEKEFTI